MCTSSYFIESTVIFFQFPLHFPVVGGTNSDTFCPKPVFGQPAAPLQSVRLYDVKEVPQIYPKAEGRVRGK